MIKDGKYGMPLLRIMGITLLNKTIIQRNFPLKKVNFTLIRKSYDKRNYLDKKVTKKELLCRNVGL